MLATMLLYRRSTIRWLLIEAVQRAWRRHEVIVPLYRRLAARAPDEQRESLLLQMAERERRHQLRYERMLSRLRAPLPRGVNLFDRLWLWLLPRCGPDLALRWAAWAERRDTRAILEAAMLLRSILRGR
ncbi:MAG: hypothetical protein N2378_01995 [Chloroflexaceae bacterium]|nr:hypothetical protein [Chloroflexaceae bacterium]